MEGGGGGLRIEGMRPSSLVTSRKAKICRRQAQQERESEIKTSDRTLCVCVGGSLCPQRESVRARGRQGNQGQVGRQTRQTRRLGREGAGPMGHSVQELQQRLDQLDVENHVCAHDNVEHARITLDERTDVRF
jgi:hypothetical protein